MVFQLPDEDQEFREHIDGPKICQALRDWDQELRSVAKHGQDEAKAERADHIRQELRRVLGDEDLSIWDW